MRSRSTPVLLLMLVCAAAQAQQPPAPLVSLAERALNFDVATAPAGWLKVASATLDTMRGGFTTETGLSLSLGIERLVSINGQVVSQTNFQIANMGNISSDEARQAQAAINSVTLVQTGVNNFTVGDPGRGTFVQNSLNGQTISSQTIISSSVNSMSLLKDLNFQGGLLDANIRGIGTH